MQVRRRELLGVLAAAAFVYGLDRLAHGGDDAKEKADDAPPQWFTDALAEMKAATSPGVAFVLPAGREARTALLLEIQTLLREASFDAQVHLVEAVYVVVAGVHAGAKEGETLVLLDADGKRVGGSTAKFVAADFARTIHPLLRNGDRLATRAKAARTPEVERLLSELTGDDAKKTAAAGKRLVEDFAAAGPAVIAAFEATTVSDEAMRLTSVIHSVFARRRGDQGEEHERPLPFGTKWKKGPPSKNDGCGGCGMMRIVPRSRDTLEYLVKGAAEAK